MVRQEETPKPVASPFLVLVDQREKLPYGFDGLRTDAKHGRRPLKVRTIPFHLDAGDYSIEGYESRIAIERKSLADAFGTLGQGRDRFERELQRLASYEVAAVVIEASWADILAGHPRSNLNPKTIHRSLIAWQQEFGNIHWWTCDGRAMAEATTYRILERFWTRKQKTMEV